MILAFALGMHLVMHVCMDVCGCGVLDSMGVVCWIAWQLNDELGRWKMMSCDRQMSDGMRWKMVEW